MTRRKWLNAAFAWVLAAVTAVTSVPLTSYAAENTPVTQVTTLEEQEKEGEPDAEDPGEDADVNNGEETDAIRPEEETTPEEEDRGAMAVHLF